MTARRTVKLTANFEHNLEEVEAFLLKADAPQAFDALLDELMDTVIPNLDRFPAWVTSSSSGALAQSR